MNSSLESASNVENDRMEWRSKLGMDISESDKGVEEEPEDEGEEEDELVIGLEDVAANAQEDVVMAELHDEPECVPAL